MWIICFPGLCPNYISKTTTMTMTTRKFSASWFFSSLLSVDIAKWTKTVLNDNNNENETIEWQKTEKSNISRHTTTKHWCLSSMLQTNEFSEMKTERQKQNCNPAAAAAAFDHRRFDLHIVGNMGTTEAAAAIPHAILRLWFQSSFFSFFRFFLLQLVVSLFGYSSVLVNVWEFLAFWICKNAFNILYS